MSTSGGRIEIVVDLERTVDGLITQANTIAAALGNPENQSWFGGITPTPAEITDAAQALAAAQVIAKTRVQGAVQARKLKRDALETLLKDGATSVEVICRANAGEASAIAAASGYREKAPHTHFKLPLELKNGALSGTVKAMAKAAKTKRAWYDWRWSADGGHTWTQVPGTNDSSTLLTGLTPLTTVLVQVRTTIKNVAGDWSDPVSILVK
jgi:hypothetical protein